MSFWDSDGANTSGWSADPSTAARIAPDVYVPAAATAPISAPATPPTQQAMIDAWNANRADPAKIHDLMQANGVSLDDAAKLLGVNQSAMAGYLNSGRKQTNIGEGVSQGVDPSGDQAPATYNYAQVVPMASQSLDQFLSDNKDKIDPATGKFYGPDRGVNYELEGASAKDYYNQNIGVQRGALTGSGNNMQFDPSVITGFNDNLNARTAWQEGPDNGGGFLGGLGRNFDKMIHDPHAWAVLAMALTAGAINPGEVGAAEAAAGAGEGAAAAETAGTTAATAGGTEVGGAAGIGSGTTLGGATGSTASGLAGQLGMQPGLAANALNSGALSTGMSLARGNNIGDSLKNGIVSAAMSPIGSMASSATTSALGNSVSPLVSSVASSVAGSAAQGGARAALTGQNIGSGIIAGAKNGFVDAAGSYIGGQVQSATGSNLAGNAASGLTRSALNGTSPLTALTSAGVGAVANQITSNISGFSDLSPTQKSMIVGMVTSALQGKSPSQALINQVTSLAINQVAGARPAKNSIRTGGWTV